MFDRHKRPMIELERLDLGHGARWCHMVQPRQWIGAQIDHKKVFAYKGKLLKFMEISKW